MTKLKYILIIVGSVVIGVIVGWFIWSGGQISLNIADVTLRVDTVRSLPNDTVALYKTIIRLQTITEHDTIFNSTHDTLLTLDLKKLTASISDGKKPILIDSLLWVSLPYEQQLTFYSFNDTIDIDYKFPDLTAIARVRRGIDSIFYKERTVYKDYWFDSWFVQVPIYCSCVGLGALVNSGEAK